MEDSSKGTRDSRNKTFRTAIKVNLLLYVSFGDYQDEIQRTIIWDFYGRWAWSRDRRFRHLV